MDGKIPGTAPASKEHWCQIQLLQKETFFFLQRSLNPLKKRLRFLALPLWWMCLPHGPFWQLLCNFTVSTTFMVGVSFVEKIAQMEAETVMSLTYIYADLTGWVPQTQNDPQWFRLVALSSLSVLKHVDLPSVCVNSGLPWSHLLLISPVYYKGTMYPWSIFSFILKFSNGKIQYILVCSNCRDFSFPWLMNTWVHFVLGKMAQYRYL